jgi:hypothetical protein
MLGGRRNRDKKENSPFYKGIFAVRILKVEYHLESNAEATVKRETYDCIRRGYTPEVLREIRGLRYKESEVRFDPIGNLCY